MPWTSLSKAKKAGAITNFRKKPMSITAVNKLYDIYDSIKAKGKTDNAMAVAMSTWKGLVVLKNGVWALKPASKKESKEQVKKEQNEIPLPAGATRVGDGSFEAFRDRLRDALIALFGKKYLYLVATYRTKVVIGVDESERNTYYEVPYKVKNGQFDFGTAVKVVKQTRFQKAEQKNWREYRESVKAFVQGKTSLGDVVGIGVRVKRIAL